MSVEPVFLELLGLATKNVIETMGSMPCEVGEPYQKSGDSYFGSITGLIGMAGDKTNGTIAISFDRPTICTILFQMLGEQIVEINDDVRDAAGELTNMICGDYKRRLSEIGVVVGMATPLIISGTDVHIRDRVTRVPMVVPIKTSAGNMVVETNLAKTK